MTQRAWTFHDDGIDISDPALFDGVNRLLEATAQPHHFWGTWRDLVSWVRGDLYTANDDERLQVFRMIREAGLFPEDAVSFLILRTLRRVDPPPASAAEVPTWLRARDERRLADRVEQDWEQFARDVGVGRDLLIGS
jgi:hypothetical protein